MKILFLALLLSGCTSVCLENGDFHGCRRALFTNLEGNIELTAPGGVTLKANSLKSTVDTEALNNLISAVAGAAKP